jgi:hypothetical protein
MIEMLTNASSYCPSHNYPFEATNFTTKASHQQFDLGCVIHICNVSSLARDMIRMNCIGVLKQ